MAARGSIAKENVEKIIKEAFGKSFVGVSDKKIYVTADDGGEQVQISISLTCPKNPIEVVSGDGQGFDFSNPTMAATTFTPAEYTEEEKETINELMRALNL